MAHIQAADIPALSACQTVCGRASAKQAISRLKLIGTVHGDPVGLHSTLRILRQLRPGLIFIELSPYGYRFRREHGLSMIQMLDHHLAEAARRSSIPYDLACSHPQVQAIRGQIRLPFEYRAAAIAAAMMPAKIFLVDQSTFSRKLIAHWHELISVENLVNLLAMTPESPSIQAIYRKASVHIFKGFSAGISGSSEADSEERFIWVERETFMARKILRIMSAFKRDHAVYVGGWWHLTTGGKIPTLRDLLGISSAACILLGGEQRK